MLLCMLEGDLCLLEVLEGDGVPKVMCCVLLYMLEAVEGAFYLRYRRCLEVTRRVLLCMLETVEGGLCLLEALVVSDMSRIPVGSAQLQGFASPIRDAYHPHCNDIV